MLKRAFDQMNSEEQKILDDFISPRSKERRKGPCESRPSFLKQRQTFEGSNDENEIEDIGEFRDKIRHKDLATLSMEGWVFQAVDFSEENLENWNKMNLRGAEFLGCTFPKGVSSAEVRARGGVVWENNPNVPFTPLRAFMYRQEELREKDAEIYKYYLTKKTVVKTLAEAMHDHSMLDAMMDYLEGKTPIGVMGGHRLSRKSSEYSQLVLLCRKLVLKGFLIVTGGGPGAMEAANLGAYLANKTEEQVSLALKIIAQDNDEYENVEYLNHQPPENVIQALGSPDYMPSIGVPTYRYGHEPSNKFATWHAKFFSNAIREDGLLSISVGGIIYVCGGAGTRQEIFQAACHNTYCTEQETRPLILLGKSFWTENNVWKALEHNARGCEFYNHLLLTDDYDQVIDHLVKHAEQKNLPLISNLEDLKKPFWKTSEE